MWNIHLGMSVVKDSSGLVVIVPSNVNNVGAIEKRGWHDRLVDDVVLVVVEVIQYGQGEPQKNA